MNRVPLVRSAMYFASDWRCALQLWILYNARGRSVDDWFYAHTLDAVRRGSLESCLGRGGGREGGHGLLVSKL